MLERELKKASVSLDNFCQAMERGEDWDCAEVDDPDVVHEIIRLGRRWLRPSPRRRRLRVRGWSWSPRFHNADNDGDRYDDVSGGFFHVDGVYRLTPAGKKFAGKIERKFFVTFGWKRRHSLGFAGAVLCPNERISPDVQARTWATTHSTWEDQYDGKTTHRIAVGR